jgi:hypothetical protein
MPFSPLLVLKARSGTKFQLLPLFHIVGPTLGLARNLGARHKRCNRKLMPLNIGLPLKLKAYFVQGKHALKSRST